MSDSPTPVIRRLIQVSERQLRELAELLIGCVAGGAGVTFMHPVSAQKAEAFWRGIAEDAADGRRGLLVAEDDGGVVGTVMLVLDLPENQPHRAEVAKMLVHPRARRRGLGAALMRAAEELASECGRTLLVLDTVTGSDAERLYARLGWQRVGEIPEFSLLPHGGMTATTYFYRELPDSQAEQR
jgi:GNAT superfamily N-acetyltransferase